LGSWELGSWGLKIVNWSFVIGGEVSEVSKVSKVSEVSEVSEVSRERKEEVIMNIEQGISNVEVREGRSQMIEDRRSSL
jgi:hypothetical protein